MDETYFFYFVRFNSLSDKHGHIDHKITTMEFKDDINIHLIVYEAFTQHGYTSQS